MARLRAPGGCPWDREQTFDSIKPYTLEEAYEVLEAIDDRDWPELTGELGDLLLQVLFYSEMAREAGYFSVDDVLDRLSNKLVDRHPHVFGDVKADTSAEVLRNWEALKAEEKKKRLEARGEIADENSAKQAGSDNSVLAGVSSRVPALMEALKLSSRAARVGFDWPEIEGLFEKLAEETSELREELKSVPLAGPPGRKVANSGKHNISAAQQERARRRGQFTTGADRNLHAMRASLDSLQEFLDSARASGTDHRSLRPVSGEPSASVTVLLLAGFHTHGKAILLGRERARRIGRERARRIVGLVKVQHHLAVAR